MIQGETVEYVPTLHFHQRHNKPMFWLTHLWLPWSHHPVAREDTTSVSTNVVSTSHSMSQLVLEKNLCK
jgi:hypothetical protein